MAMKSRSLSERALPVEWLPKIQTFAACRASTMLATYRDSELGSWPTAVAVSVTAARSRNPPLRLGDSAVVNAGAGVVFRRT
jgi:hypothetical protein